MNLKSNKGFTLVEMVVVMLLMGILGTLVMKFMINGNTFYKKTYTDYDGRNEARLAVHYISSRIRQNDSMCTDSKGADIGAIGVKDNTITIAITKDTGEIDTGTVDTIYYNKKDKKLYEEVTIASGSIKKTKIADASSFEVELKEGNSIVMTIGYKDSSELPKTYTETLTIRSYN